MTNNNYRRQGKPLYLGKRTNKYAGGGNFLGSGQPAGQALSATGALGGMGGALSAGVGVVNNVMSGGNKTEVGQVMQGLGAAASSIPGIGGIIGAGVQLLGGLVDSMFGSNIDPQKVAELEAKNKAMTGYNSNATNTQSLLADFKAKPTSEFNKEDIGTQGWFSTARDDKYNELNEAKKKAEAQAQTNLSNTSNNLVATNTLSSLANIAAKGGKIHIKPENKGKFTSYCGGKVTTECINRGKHSSSPAVRKRATFAQNARGWHHAEGGPIHSGTGVFTNNVTTIGNGNTHEMNPNEGVQIGVDPQGVPNLVEQGEVIYNDYVFSNRIQADKDSLEMVGINPKNKKFTYAAIAEKLTKESAERPNDPISKKGLQDSMARLAQSQELQKQVESAPQKEGNKFKEGGKKQNATGFVPAFSNFNLGRFGDLTGIDIDPTSTKYMRAIEDVVNLPGTKERRAQERVQQNIDKQMSLPAGTTTSKTNAPGAPSTPTIPTTNQTAKPIGMEWMRYLPALDVADIFAKEDYSNADSLINNRATVSPKSIGNYLAPKPFDRDYAANQLRAQSAAAERNIIENSGGNRGAAQAGLLAAGMNSQNALGNLYRQAEEYNRADAMRTEEFNRGTNMFNAQADMQSQQFNAENFNRNLAMRAQMRDAERTRISDNRSGAISNVLQNLGNIGKENFTMNMVNSSPDRYRYNPLTGQVQYEGENKAAKGGKLNKKRKGGYTYGR